MPFFVLFPVGLGVNPLSMFILFLVLYFTWVIFPPCTLSFCGWDRRGYQRVTAVFGSVRVLLFEAPNDEQHAG